MCVGGSTSRAVFGLDAPPHGERNHAKKNKTNKSVLKRLKRTASGKLKHAQCGKRHLNAHFNGKKRRQLRGTVVTTGPLVKKYLIAMGQY